MTTSIPVGGVTPAMAATPVVATGAPLSSVARRLGAYVLDGVLALVTLGIGWVIWAMVTWSRGQSPAKQLLHMRCVRADTGKALGWGGMFVREFVMKGVVVTILSVFTLGIVGLVAPLLILGGTLRQTMWDRLSGTVVVDDADDRTL